MSEHRTLSTTEPVDGDSIGIDGALNEDDLEIVAGGLARALPPGFNDVGDARDADLGAPSPGSAGPD